MGRTAAGSSSPIDERMAALSLTSVLRSCVACSVAAPRRGSAHGQRNEPERALGSGPDPIKRVEILL